MGVPLREIPEQLAADRVDLLREETEIVRVSDHPFEHLSRPCDLTPEREVVDEPEAAQRERPLSARQTVVGRRKKAHQRNDEGAGVQGRDVERLRERLLRPVVSLRQDGLPNLVARALPARHVTGHARIMCQANGAVESDQQSSFEYRK